MVVSELEDILSYFISTFLSRPKLTKEHRLSLDPNKPSEVQEFKLTKEKLPSLNQQPALRHTIVFVALKAQGFK